jgi:hypothetical protein
MASSVSDAASAAAAATAAVASAASDATVAKSKVVVIESCYVKSTPGTNSFAVHEIMRTSAGLVKFVYSSVAAA